MGVLPGLNDADCIGLTDVGCLESTLGVIFQHCVFRDFRIPNGSGGFGKASRVKNPTFRISRTGNCRFQF
jgi:hypothetical protein